MMLEAQCPKCGETYNPESLKAEDVQHWHDKDQSFGGKPSKVWEYDWDSGTIKTHQLTKKITNWKGNLLGVLIVGGTIAVLAWMFFNEIGIENNSLVPCATEDSDNCYWDADERGNGQGRDFFRVDGVTTYED